GGGGIRSDFVALVHAHDRPEYGEGTPAKAPAEFIDQMLRGIVGIEIVVTRLEGKAKLSQNRTPEDQAAVIEALANASDPSSREVAAAMRARARRTPPR